MAQKADFIYRFRQEGTEKVSNKFKGLKKDVNGLSSSVKRLAVVFGAGFLGKQMFDAGRGAINTAAQFETLKVRLGNMYGSVQRGTQAFDAFNKVAATTPFQLQNVVEAGAALKAFGADAEEMIKPVSDLAAFMGVDVVDAANAMGRAFAGGAGAADVLRDKGILQLIKDSEGIVDLTKLTLPEFRDAMVRALSDPDVGIAGATTKLADTWNGAVSNFQDGIDRLKAAIGEQLIEKLRPKLDAINAELSRMGEIGWDNIGRSMTDNLNNILEVLQISAGAGGKIIGIKILEGMQFTIETLMPSTTSAIASALKLQFPILGDAMAQLIGQIAPSTQGALFEFKGFGDEIANIMASTSAQIKALYDKIIEDAQIHKDQQEQVQTATKDIVQKSEDDTIKKIKHSAETKIKVGNKLLGSLADLNKEAKGSAIATARIQQTQATIDSIAAAQAAVAPPPRGYGWNPVGIAAAVAAAASGLANVVAISQSINDFKSFATGGSFVTGGDELIRVGDNPTGREVVNVTPLDAAGEPTGGGGMMTINISGNVMSENYTEDVIIPHIKEALRRGESI